MITGLSGFFSPYNCPVRENKLRIKLLDEICDSEEYFELRCFPYSAPLCSCWVFWQLQSGAPGKLVKRCQENRQDSTVKQSTFVHWCCTHMQIGGGLIAIPWLPSYLIWTPPQMPLAVVQHIWKTLARGRLLKGTLSKRKFMIAADHKHYKHVQSTFHFINMCCLYKKKKQAYQHPPPPPPSTLGIKRSKCKSYYLGYFRQQDKKWKCWIIYFRELGGRSL